MKPLLNKWSLRAIAAVNAAYFGYTIVYYKQFFVGQDLPVFIAYLIPGAAAFLFLASEWFPEHWKLQILLLTFSAAVAAFLVETGLTLIPALHNFLPEARAQLIAKAKRELLTDLRSKGVDAVPGIFADALWIPEEERLRSRIALNGHEVLPLGGAMSRRVVECLEDEEFLVYDSDEHGFHNPSAIWRTPKLQIAAIGDSFANGNCVAPDSNFVALIRRHHPLTLNLGRPSAGPLIELAAIREYLPTLKPGIVLWFYCEQNDFANLGTESKSPLLMRYIQQEDFTQNLIAKRPELDEKISEIIHDADLAASVSELSTLENLTKFVALTRLRRTARIWSFAAVNTPWRNVRMREADYVLFKQILNQAQKEVRSWDGRLYFVYLPTWDRYGGFLYRNLEYLDQVRDRVLSEVRSLGIPVIDLEPAFRGHARVRSLFSKFGPHYSVEGNRLVADVVLLSIAN